ncbi:uncharacterized protein LOC135493446 [Lineus longissimus]|uniref:uncharacterized protein LOC135493446 n=1 Tax=Lineus longissimus TaxID=88925 RepID=UPI002B4FAA1E
MKCILAVVVLVAMATKMTQACCLPDEVKADVFFTMNISVTLPGVTFNREINGMGNFAVDFKGQRFAFVLGRVGTRDETFINGASFVVDFSKRLVTASVVGSGVPGSDDEDDQCFSNKIKGKLTDKHQCYIDNAGLMQVVSTPELTIYAAADNDTQITLGIDADCIPKLLQTVTTMPNNTGAVDIKMSVDNIELQVEDADFASPCDNPTPLPGPSMKVPAPEESLKVLSSSMIAQEKKRRR